MSVASAWLARSRQELAANPRLKFGAIAIAGLLVVYLFLVLLDWRAAAAERYVQDTTRLAKMRGLAGQDVWITRAQSAQRVLKALQAEIPTVETVGVAQAQLSSWVRDLGQTSGSKDVQIQQRPPEQVQGMPGIWRIPVTMSGTVGPDQVVQIIRQVEQRETLTVIEQATVLNKENRTYSLTMVALVRIPERSADAVR